MEVNMELARSRKLGLCPWRLSLGILLALVFMKLTDISFIKYHVLYLGNIIVKGKWEVIWQINSELFKNKKSEGYSEEYLFAYFVCGYIIKYIQQLYVMHNLLMAG